MSHRTQQSRGFYLKLPENLQLPLYSSHSYGYCIQDDSLSGRVQRALQNERAGLPLVKHAARDREWPRLAGVLAFLRRVLGCNELRMQTFHLAHLVLQHHFECVSPAHSASPPLPSGVAAELSSLLHEMLLLLGQSRRPGRRPGRESAPILAAPPRRWRRWPS